jgi:hypothetical protein
MRDKNMMWFSLFVAAAVWFATTSAIANSSRVDPSNVSRLYAQNDDGSDVVVPPIRPGQPPGPVPGAGGWPGPGPAPTPQPAGVPPGVQLGNVCYTAQGAYAGPYHEVGAPCFVILPNGFSVPGVVGMAGVLPRVLPAPGMQ